MTANQMTRALLLPALAASLCLCACGDDAPARPAAKARTVKAAGGTVAAAAPSAAEAAGDAQFVYTYNPISKRDPFRSPAVLRTAAGGPGPLDPGSLCTDVLCQYSLDDLHLVAVVSGDANPMGMLEDRSGTGHIVRRNTKVGRAGGKVTQVLRDCIVITSFVTTSDGKAQPVKTNMCVARDQRAAPVLDLLQGKFRE